MLVERDLRELKRRIQKKSLQLKRRILKRVDSDKQLVGGVVTTCCIVHNFVSQGKVLLD